MYEARTNPWSYLSFWIIVMAVMGPLCPLKVCKTLPEMMSVTKVTEFFAPDATKWSPDKAMLKTGLR